jgi:adenylate kinase
MLRSEDIRLQEVIEEEYAKLFIEERDELRKEAKQQIKKIQEENIKNYNRKRKMLSRTLWVCEHVCLIICVDSCINLSKKK